MIIGLSNLFKLKALCEPVKKYRFPYQTEYNERKKKWSILDVPVFRQHSFDKDYGPNGCDDIWMKRAIANHKLNKKNYNWLPSVVPGHNPDKGKGPEKPTIGLMDNPVQKGIDLYYDFIDLDEDVYNHLRKGGFPNRSCETLAQAGEVVACAVGSFPPKFKFEQMREYSVDTKKNNDEKSKWKTYQFKETEQMDEKRLQEILEGSLSKFEKKIYEAVDEKVDKVVALVKKPDDSDTPPPIDKNEDGDDMTEAEKAEKKKKDDEAAAKKDNECDEDKKDNADSELAKKYDALEKRLKLTENANTVLVRSGEMKTLSSDLETMRKAGAPIVVKEQLEHVKKYSMNADQIKGHLEMLDALKKLPKGQVFPNFVPESKKDSFEEIVADYDENKKSYRALGVTEDVMKMSAFLPTESYSNFDKDD